MQKENKCSTKCVKISPCPFTLPLKPLLLTSSVIHLQLTSDIDMANS